MPDNSKIYVTRPALPPFEEYSNLVRTIWDNGQLTNNGPLHCQLETELAAYLGVKYISLFSSGTLALVTALKAMNITGEVIATPYSFVGTTHALAWNGIRPVFTDIEPGTCNLDPEKIEAAITPQTTAIMPVHVYGNPCNMDRIREIADANGLKVIYDACHTFNVRINNEPVLKSGDLSVISFHATKVFTTGEGGAIVSHDPEMKNRIDRMKNFGITDETHVSGPGINAKMNEMQAALGLLQLNHINGYINERKRIAAYYREKLAGIKGLRFMSDIPGVKHCYSYFPVFINEDEYGHSRDAVYDRLKHNDIFCRRYFYPLISRFPGYADLPSARPENLPVAEKNSREVICLPIYPGLPVDSLDKIIDLLENY
jgi:dTDP-4-amino-4,6-dideoxygalactose transaminase